MMIEFLHILNQSLIISLFVFSMMLIVDYLNVLSRGRMPAMMRGGVWRQYLLSSFLGATPGCLGAFTNVSLYVRGLLSFGAIVGGMIATSGDEAFVMFALFPKIALILTVLLFFIGIFLAWVTDKIVPLLKIKPCEECKYAPLHIEDENKCRCFDISVWRSPSLNRVIFLIIILSLIIVMGVGLIGPEVWNWQKKSVFTLLFIVGFIIATVPNHYLDEHIIMHVIRKHIWRVFLWTFSALLFIHYGLNHWNLAEFVRSHLLWVLLISAFVGLIPESGPHLVFVTMFAGGLIPFSVLLTSSIVQDGHGILPLLSYSIKDTLLIKLFNLVFGLGLGTALYIFGL